MRLRFGQGLKFLVSGALAASVLLSVLYVLHGVFGIWYLGASIVAFAFAVTVNFLTQRYWTFKTEGAPTRYESATFVLVNLATLAVNILSMFLLVEYLHLNYLLAQIVVQAVLAGVSFYSYQKIFS